MKNKNYYVIIYVILIISLLCVTYFWIKFDISSKYVQYALNVSASLLSIIITVSIVDNLIKRNEVERSKPLKSAMYEEIRLFIILFIDFWQEIHISTSEKHNAIELHELFTKETFEEMLLRLNLDKSPNITPKTNWWYWLNIESDKFSSMLDKIMSRYINVMDPKIFMCIHYIAEEDFLLKGLKDIKFLKDYDEKNDLLRPRYLAAYLTETDQKFLNSIIQIYDWCKKEYKYLKASGYDIFEPYYTINITATHYNSRFSDEEIEFQNSRWNEQTKKGKI